MASYNVGRTLDLSSKETIIQGLEEFVEILEAHPEIFEEGLKLANEAYSQKQLVEKILEV